MDAQIVRTALGTLQGDPESKEAWQSLSQAIQNQDGDLDRDGVEELFRVARERHRVSGDARAVYGLLELSARMLRGSPFEANLRQEQIHWMQHELGKGRGALGVAERAVADFPGDAALAQVLSELKERTEHWKEQSESYLAEAESASDDPYQSAMLMRAAEAELCFAPEPSQLRIEENLERAVRLDATNLHAAHLLETFYREEQRWEEVARVLERIADRAPDKQARVLANLRLARVFSTRLSDPARAALTYDRVLEADPNQADARAYATEYFSSAERWDDLARLYERPLRNVGPSPALLGEFLQIALLHWKKRKDPADAEPWFDLARRIDPAHELVLAFYREYKSILNDDAGLIHILQAAQRSLGTNDERNAALAEEVARLTLAQAGAQKAIEEYKAALRADPASARVREQLKTLYKQTQGHIALVELLRQELERTPLEDLETRLRVLREIATVYREYIKSDTALVGVLNQIVQLDGKLDEHDVEEVRELAALHERLGRPRELLVSKKLLAEIVPDVEEKKALYRSIGRAWLDQFSQVQHAIEAFVALYALDPQDAEAIERLDELYRKRRAWKELAELYQEQLAHREGMARVPLLKELAQLTAERLGNIEEALALYGQILDQDPTRSDVLSRMEKYAERSKNLGSLADVLERQVSAMAVGEERVPVLMKLGGVYDQLEDPEKSLSAWMRVVEAQPGNARAMRVLRDALLRGNRFDELEQLYVKQGELEALAEVLSTAADRATEPSLKLDLSYRAARTYEELLNQGARAVRSYERILATKPDDRVAIERLLVLYEQEEKWARIPPLLESLVATSRDAPDKVSALERLSKVLSGKLGDKKGAALAARRAFELSPESAASLDLLESACRAAGNWDEMVQALVLRVQVLEGRAGPALGAKTSEEHPSSPSSPAASGAAAKRPAKKRKSKGSKTVSDPPASLPPETLQGSAPPPPIKLEVDTAARGARRQLLMRLSKIQGEELGEVGAALASLRKLGEESPGDVEVLALFEELLRRERRLDDERWLYAHRAAHDADGADAYFSWALFEENQGELGEALRLYGLGVGEGRDRVPALEAVVRLAAGLEKPELGGSALERLSEILDGEKRAQKQAALAALYAGPLGRPRDALVTLEQALQGGAERGQIIAVLKRLVDEPEVRGDAARALGALYEAGGDARQEADAMRALLSETKEDKERASIYERLIQIFDQKLKEPSGALSVTLDALTQFPDRMDLWQRATDLAERAGRPTDLLEALRAAIRRELAPDTTVELAQRAATICEEILQDQVGATPFYEKILAVRPEDEGAWSRLREILTASERWSELEDLCVREIKRTDSAARKIDLLSEVALLAEDILNDGGRAIQYHRQALELDPSLESSLEALDRLLTRQNRRQELSQVLDDRIELSRGHSEIQLRIRAAKLAIDLHDPERAMAQTEQVLRVDSSNYEARDVAETLLQIGNVRLRAANLLEMVYEAKDEIRDLVRVLGVRVEALRPAEGAPRSVEQETERRDLLRRIATLRDDRLHDDSGSFDVFAELVPLDPIEADLRGRLIEAGRRLGKSERVVEVLFAADLAAAGNAAVKAEILLSIAKVQENTLADIPAALVTLGRVVALKSEQPEQALLALKTTEGHLLAEGRYEELTRNLTEQIGLEFDAHERAELQGRLAHIYSDVLGERALAVKAWEGRLEELPEDPASLLALSDLYDEEGRYADLGKVLMMRRDAAPSDQARQSLTLSLAELEEGKLGQPERAIESYQTLLDEAGPRPDVLAALARLFLRANRFAALADIFEKQSEVLEDETARLGALSELGLLRSGQLNDISGAVEAHRQALTIDSHHTASREALLALLDGKDEPTRLEVADILLPIFETEGNYEGQLKLAEVQASASDDPHYRAEKYRRATEICEDLLNDPGRALSLALRGLPSAVQGDGLPEYFSVIDRLAGVTGRRADQAQALHKIVRDIFDGDLQLATYHKLGALYRDDLSDLEHAITAYSSALEVSPEDASALGALDDLYLELGKSAELVSILDRRLELALGEEEQKELLYRKARLFSGALGEPQRAIETYEALVDIALEPEAVASLSELYTTEARFDDLCALIERQIESAQEGASPYHIQLAKVLIDKQAQTERGLDELDNALLKNPSSSEAISYLEGLTERELDGPAKTRVGGILERVFLARSDFRGLLRALKLQLEGTESPLDRRELATKMAQIHEEQGEDYGSALRMNALLLADDPQDELTLSEMERLTRVLGDNRLLGEILKAQVERAGVDGEATARIAKRAGEIYLSRGEPAQAVTLFESALAFLPDDPQLFAWADEALARSGTPEDRIEFYREALETRYDAKDRIDLLQRIASLAESQGDVGQAVSAHQDVLLLEEQNTSSFEALRRVFTSQAKWTELAALYEQRTAILPSIEAAPERLKYAGLLRDKLGDAEGALDQLDTLLKELPSFEPALEAIEGLRLAKPELRERILGILVPIYEESDNFMALLGLHQDRLDLAPDSHARADILKEAAVLVEHRAGDRARAMELLSQALVLESDDEGVRESLEGLAEKTQSYRELSATYLAILESLSDPLVRSSYLRRVAQLYNRELDDPRAALSTYVELLSIEPEDIESQGIVIRLATLLGDWPGLERGLSLRAESALEPLEKRNALVQLGELRHLSLGVPEGAIEAYEAALDEAPGDAEILDRLIELYEGQENPTRLVELYLNRAEVGREEPALAFEFLSQAARLFETALADRPRAIDAWLSALEHNPGDTAVHQELDRLYEVEERWNDLIEHLKHEAGSAVAPAARLSFRHRMASVYRDKLGDSVDALEVYRLILEEHPADAIAIAAVFDIAAQDEALEAMAAQMLTTALAQTGFHADWVRALELSLKSELDSHARFLTLRKIAEIEEHQLKRAPSAFDALLRAVEVEPSGREAHTELLRLALSPEQQNRYAKVLTGAAEAAYQPELAQELWVRLGELYRDRLSEKAEAAAAFEKATEQAGDQPGLLVALEELYGELGEDESVILVLERRLPDLAHDPGAQATLLTKQGERYFTGLKDPVRAFEAFRRALELDPGQERASELLERIHAQSQEQLYQETFEVLEGIYRQRQQSGRLSELHQGRLRRASDPLEKVELRRNLSRVLEDDCGDPGAALAVLLQGLEEDPESAGLLDEVERLLPITGSYLSAAASLLRASDATETAELSSEFCLKAAEWYLQQAEQPPLALAALRKAAKFTPNDDSLYEQIGAIEERIGDESGLLETLKKRVLLAPDEGTKIALLRKVAELALKLADRVSAEAALREILGLESYDLDALSRLSELLAASGPSAEVLELLLRRAEAEVDPSSARSLRLRAARLARDGLGQSKVATEVFELLFEEDPSDAETTSELIVTYEKSEQFSKLAELYERLSAASASPERRRELSLLLARLHLSELESPEYAVEILEQILAEDPRFAGTSQLLADVYEARGRNEDLVALLGREVELAREDNNPIRVIDISRRRAMLAEVALKDLELARDVWRSIRELDDSEDTLEPLVRLELSLGHKASASQILEEWAGRVSGPAQAKKRLELAALYRDLGDGAGVIRSLEAALAILPEDAKLSSELRAEYERQEHWPEVAAMVVNEAERAKTAPAQIELFREASEILRQRCNDLRASAEVLGRAAEIGAEDRALQLEYCDALSRAGRGSEAILVLSRIVDSYGGKRAKELADIHRRIAVASLSMGDDARALDELDKAFRIEPGNIGVLAQLGEVALRSGDIKKAQQMYRALLLQKLDGPAPVSKAEVFYRLGLTHVALGEGPKAKQMFERAVQADPSLTDAQAELAKL